MLIMGDDIQSSDRCRSLFRKVSELESFVSEALKKGVRAKELKEIVDDATTHSRRKAIILQHVDSSLLLSAVQHAKEEISRLPEVTATNAQVMADLESSFPCQVPGPAEDPLSTQSDGGTFIRGPAAAAASLPVEIPGGVSMAPSASEDGSALQDKTEMGCFPKTPAPTPRGSATLPPPAPSAANVVQSLRAFAAEVAEEAKARPGPSFRALSDHLHRAKSDEMAKSRDYDFELAESPRAAYYMTDSDFNPFRPSRLDQAGSWTYSEGGAPITTDYALASPRYKAQGEQPFGRAAAEGCGAGVEGAHCAAGVPPGLNPLAVAEGHGEDDTPGTPVTEGDLPLVGEDEEGVFGDDCLAAGYLEGYECSTATPPKHVLQRLAQSIRRLSV